MDISRDRQHIDRVFSNAAYYIDFYQREAHQLDLQPLDNFGPDELEARHKLLFQLIGIIWK